MVGKWVDEVLETRKGEDARKCVFTIVRNFRNLDVQGVNEVIKYVYEKMDSDTHLLIPLSICRITSLARDSLPSWEALVGKLLDEANRRGEDGESIVKGLI